MTKIIPALLVLLFLKLVQVLIDKLIVKFYNIHWHSLL